MEIKIFITRLRSNVAMPLQLNMYYIYRFIRENMFAYPVSKLTADITTFYKQRTIIFAKKSWRFTQLYFETQAHKQILGILNFAISH